MNDTPIYGALWLERQLRDAAAEVAAVETVADIEWGDES